MKNIPLPRLDTDEELRSRLLKYCRVQPGGIWRDPAGRHSVGCFDAASDSAVLLLMGEELATLAIQDPPYNLVAFGQRELSEYVEWCTQWVRATERSLAPNSSLYVWLGADQRCGYQPLPDFMIMMRQMPFQSRSLITMRNQRGYGTQHNWMAVRQELLYYIKGKPQFDVGAEYTDIPKILRGYYKEVGGEMSENLERSNSENIRAGNVWVDIQQVFYRMEENVNGCYAQKPLKSSERIISASSHLGDAVLDLFCHSGTTLIASELQGRRCFTSDIDPIFCEIAIRRLERLRKSGKTGWQNGNPFEDELHSDPTFRELYGALPVSRQQSLFEKD
jgi:DNA modification methylase